MTSSNWTLESELYALTGEVSTEAALRSGGVLADTEALMDLRTLQGWIRGGAETYIYIFDVISSHRVQHLILKAFVASPGTGSLTQGLQALLQRRQILAHHGVAVPDLFLTGRATWIEEFITEDLPEAMRDEGRRQSLVTDVFLIAIALDRLGFAPIAPFADLRARASRAVMIDFGQDLGPSDISYETNACQDEAFEFLRTEVSRVSESELFRCHALAVERFVSTL